jgi:hypothetical protein
MMLVLVDVPDTDLDGAVVELFDLDGLLAASVRIPAHQNQD